MESKENVQPDPAIRIRALEEFNQRLTDCLVEEKKQSANRKAEATRWQQLAEHYHDSFVRTHDALNVLRSDAQSVLDEHGAGPLHRELQDLRERYALAQAKRKHWLQFVRRCAEAKSHVAQVARDQQEVIGQLRERIDRIEQQRDEVVRKAEETVASLEAKLIRIGDLCRIWKRGELGTMAVIAGIGAEFEGYPLPEPGWFERARATETAKDRSLMNQLSDQLSEIEAVLTDAGVMLVSTHVNQVRDLVGLYEGQQEQINEWKSWEARARGATMQILDLLGGGGTGVSALLQAGKYDEAIDAIEKERKGSG